ncbi:MipA/OmpV family protein [Colwellia sp. MEBiC06753]
MSRFIHFIFIFILSSAPFLAPSANAASDTELTEIGQLNLSVSVGAGFATNPVNGGENLPLVIVPSMSYYDEKLFFDNGVLGYTLVEDVRFAVSLVNKLNFNGFFFEDINAGSVLLATLVSDGFSGDVGAWDQIETFTEHKLTIDDIASRKWSVDTGLQVNWFIDDSWHFVASASLDSTGVHHGESAHVEISKLRQIDSTQLLVTSFGINWQSSQVNNYYYGISERDTDQSSMFYQTTDAWMPYIKVSSMTKLSDQWSLVLSTKINYIDDAITDSPLLNTSLRYVVFSGFRYDF